MLAKNGLLDEAGHGLGHIRRMHPIVVGVAPMVVLLYRWRSTLVPLLTKKKLNLTYGRKELPDQQAVQAKVSTEAQLLKQVRAQRGQVLTVGQPVEGKGVEIPIDVDVAEEVLRGNMVAVQEVPLTPESHQAFGCSSLTGIGQAFGWWGRSFQATLIQLEF